MGDVEEVLEEELVKRLDPKAYAKTTTLNLISRSSSLGALQNIFMQQGKCVIREQCIIRGDLARVGRNTETKESTEKKKKRKKEQNVF